MVVQLSKHLGEVPLIETLHGVQVRHYTDGKDIVFWLRLRELAFDGLRPQVRRWTELDFRQEIMGQRWWQPDRLWFAERAGRLVGTVTLALRGAPDREQPVVHWLAVLPEYQGHGVGRLLLAHLEKVSWDLGFRDVAVESHCDWRQAIEFYRACGFTG